MEQERVWCSGGTVQFSSVQLPSRVRLFVTPWTAARQASMSIFNSHSLLKLMSIESVMPSNHLIFCCPLLLLPSIFPSIKVFSYESVLRSRWPKYWSFNFTISPSNEYSGWFPLGWTGWISLQSKELSRVYHDFIHHDFIHSLHVKGFLQSPSPGEGLFLPCWPQHPLRTRWFYSLEMMVPSWRMGDVFPLADALECKVSVYTLQPYTTPISPHPNPHHL